MALEKQECHPRGDMLWDPKRSVNSSRRNPNSVGYLSDGDFCTGLTLDSGERMISQWKRPFILGVRVK